MISIQMNDKDVLRVSRSLKAVKLTITKPGQGVVMVSKRNKEPWEKRKAPHGRAIANFMKKHGKDPFDLNPNDVAKASKIVEIEIERSIDVAVRTGRAQKQLVKDALIKAVTFLAQIAKESLIRGRFIQSKKLEKIKLSSMKRGRCSTSYGSPPPYGIRTGRFLNGIRGSWKSLIGGNR